MLRAELLRDQGILILTPEGALEAADFARLAQEVDPFLAAHGTLNGVMICASAPLKELQKKFEF